MGVEPTKAFQPYQTESLFVLVGRNPLPNYVCAKLLLQPEGTLYLVHSEGPQGTGNVAQWLAAQFRDFRTELVAVDPRSYDEGLIYRIERCLERTAPAPIGLHYTGGTKVMAVHAYQAVEEFCESRGRPAFFSYLDADDLVLTIEHPAGKPVLARRVLDDVPVSIETLLALHGTEAVSRLTREPNLPGLAASLAQLHNTQNGIETWQASRKVLWECQGKAWVDVEKALLAAGLPAGIVATLDTALRLGAAQSIDLAAAARHVGFKSSRQLSLWLDGLWLEDWTLECAKRLGLKQRARGLARRDSRNPEIDVAFMWGYLLVALSCTVAVKTDVAKQKLFEIYNRARQIGGDEARIGLVCPVEDPASLQQHIVREWFTGDRVKVFGRQQLPDLDAHLKAWIDSI
ncbi:MAG: hypothetical protein JXA93_03590 [Anaerolineae bacterium]|nr:hypothetical protein [Anaerolineae bacterium]